MKKEKKHTEAEILSKQAEKDIARKEKLREIERFENSLDYEISVLDSIKSQVKAVEKKIAELNEKLKCCHPDNELRTVERTYLISELESKQFTLRVLKDREICVGDAIYALQFLLTDLKSKL